MTDQWPRYEVFKQERAGQPHRNVGSVHAPDAELALMNARDVFARRPSCLSLWVVPAEIILARSAAELAEEGATAVDNEGAGIAYAVCGKQSQKQAMTYVDYLGRVEARSAAEALRAALSAFSGLEVGVWWVFPESEITRSDPEDTPDFEAATSKLFRMPNQYHTVFTMRKIRRGEEGDA